MRERPRTCPSTRARRRRRSSFEAVYPRSVAMCGHSSTYPLGVSDNVVGEMFSVIWNGLKDSVLMAWEVWWALVLGFAISAIVQAWVPRERIERSLAGAGPKPIGWATALGAASSSCSYAAIAIAKSLFQKGASAARSEEG